MILFIWFYVSISFFTHTHIVNGVVVVHSHPYNPFSKDKPVNHDHSKNGYILIHFLSHFLTTVSFFTISIVVFKAALKNFFSRNNEENLSSNFFISSNGLRAPPLSIHN